MKTLDQLRGSRALQFWEQNANHESVRGENGGDILKGLPALLINDGLLATLAFAMQKKAGHERLMVEVGQYLRQRKILPQDFNDLQGFARQLCDGNSVLLQQATSEALEYISFLKRLQPPAPATQDGQHPQQPADQPDPQPEH